jgi:hypothetical protein
MILVSAPLTQNFLLWAGGKYLKRFKLSLAVTSLRTKAVINVLKAVF